MDLWKPLLLMIYYAHVVVTKHVKGSISSSSDWEYITRFCFLSKEGGFKFYFEYPVEYGIQNILLYFDEPTQWQAVYKTDTNCFQKEAVLRPENNQVLTLSPAYTWSGCKLVNSSATGWQNWYQCAGGRKFKSARERWWFFAVSHCGFKEGLRLNYSLWMTNGDDFLHKEYSADEFYIFPNHLAFFLAFVVMLGFSLAIAAALKHKQMFHSTYKLYLVSVMVKTLSLLLLTVAWGTYGTKEHGTPFNGRLFGAASEVMFLLLVVLLGKGYTITVGRLSPASAVKLTIFMTVYVVTSAILLSWEFDPGLVLYIYESPAGYGLVALRFIGWLWFCYSVFFTLKNYPEKRLFYYPFVIFYSLWFLAGPIVILVSMHAIALWIREKTVVAVENLVAFAGYLFFLVLTRPQAANKNFPYHVKTTQIGAMPTEDTAFSPVSRPLSRPKSGQRTSTGLTPRPITAGGMTELSTFVYDRSTDHNVRGPDFSSLFTVSSLKDKQPENLGTTGNSEVLTNLPPRRLPPLETPPRAPQVVNVKAPPSYDSLFRAT
ncbi:transmembrane protein 145-like [Liolophura sinensis]|uniref:transmembrane protein 145-like n=1 Tax=Liolophura sinensis TaxID=3198878 RepID=UPI0031586217